MASHSLSVLADAPATTAQPTALDQLNALVRLAAIARDRPLLEVLDAVGHAISTSLGFRHVAVNVFEPADDRYDVAVVSGPPHIRDTLLGSSNPRALIDEQLLRPEFLVGDGVYFVPGADSDWSGLHAYGEPVLDPSPAGRWRTDDALLVALVGADQTPLGFVSLDHPLSGQRPSVDIIAPLVAMAAHAAAILETTRLREESARHAAALGGLVELSTGGWTTVDDIAELCCQIAHAQQGYDAVAVLLREDDSIRIAATHGWDRTELDGPRRSAELRGLLAAPDRAWVVLERSESDADPGRDGTGHRAWGTRQIAAVIRRPGGAAIGALLVDHPRDRIAPSPERLLELRLLADHASSAIRAQQRQNELATLAYRDPLTGLSNRRALDEAIDHLAASADQVAVALFDLDHFKSVNDTHGHDSGDRVLQRFARLLQDRAPAGACVARLGGEEFCLVLPNHSIEQALAVAESLRVLTPGATAGAAGSAGITTSVGITASAGGAGLRLREFLVAADLALYRAKAAGRNRTAR